MERNEEDEMDFGPYEAFSVIGPVIRLAEIGLEKGMKPNEVVEYAIQVFKEFNNEMSKMEKDQELG